MSSSLIAPLTRSIKEKEAELECPVCLKTTCVRSVTSSATPTVRGWMNVLCAVLSTQESCVDSGAKDTSRGLPTISSSSEQSWTTQSNVIILGSTAFMYLVPSLLLSDTHRDTGFYFQRANEFFVDTEAFPGWTKRVRVYQRRLQHVVKHSFEDLDQAAVTEKIEIWSCLC